MEFEFDEGDVVQKIGTITEALRQIAVDKEIITLFPEIGGKLHELNAMEGNKDADAIELAFLNLYCEVHRSGSTYTGGEREILDQKHGYFNHPGGISPLLKADRFINKNTVLVDLGAGNGLQGLLFQLLYPHQKTIQVELSLEMIQFGKKLQRVLGIPSERVDWINQDIMDFKFDSIDFIYLYRPSKPIKTGVKLYNNLAEKLNQLKRSIVIFSIADCLDEFLNSKYQQFYTDGHLTCYQHNYPDFKDYNS